MAEDKFELALKERSEEMLKCRENLNLQSCSECEKFFDCPIRKGYVAAVYDNLSKGEIGGFDF